MAINSMHNELLFEVTGDNILDKNVQVTNKMHIHCTCIQTEFIILFVRDCAVWEIRPHTQSSGEICIFHSEFSLGLDYIKVDDVLYH